MWCGSLNGITHSGNMWQCWYIDVMIMLYWFGMYGAQSCACCGLLLSFGDMSWGRPLASVGLWNSVRFIFAIGVNLSLEHAGQTQLVLAVRVCRQILQKGSSPQHGTISLCKNHASFVRHSYHGQGGRDWAWWQRCWIGHRRLQWKLSHKCSRTESRRGKTGRQAFRIPFKVFCITHKMNAPFFVPFTMYKMHQNVQLKTWSKTPRA